MSSAGARWWRIMCLIACYALLVYAGQTLSEWAIAHLQMDLRPANQATIHQMVMAAVVLYVLLLALPFMPGVEIGLGLMFMVGPEICLLIYLSTVVGLTLSFTIGRLVPMAAIVIVFDWLGLSRARDLVAQFADQPADARLAFLLSRVPARFLSMMLRHRYVALALMVNVPGNALIGGGGGIALVAGMSRLFSFSLFVATMAVAVSPVPLIYYLAGGFS